MTRSVTTRSQGRTIDSHAAKIGWFLGSALVMFFLGTARGQELDYRLRFPNANQHYVDVSLTFHTTEEFVELMMPVWTPGSYLIREYPRFVLNLKAVGEDEQQLNAAKTRKNRWTIETQGAKQVTVNYQVYGHELSVRTNWIDSDLAVLNGAATFLVPVEQMSESIRVEVELPKSWPRSVCPLPTDPENPHRYLAANFDQLVDSPILCGKCQLFPFQVDGIDHFLVNLGDDELWDGTKAANDLKSVVMAHKKFWGELPYPSYYFLNVILNAGGGLEHDNSTLIMSGRRSMNSPANYRRWLTLCSHELFHVWNVRRLRPKGLVNYDYENEVYTEELWVAEGITSYYESLLLARAGLITHKELLDTLSAEIRSIETRPGNLVQSLTESSFDTWIDFYRPHENSANTSISYYSRGAVAGLMLDCELRRRSSGKVSLDDVMIQLYERFQETGYDNDDFRSLCEELTGEDFSSWFDDYVHQANNFAYADSLKVLGLYLTADPRSDRDVGSERGPQSEAVTLGITLRDADGQAKIAAIRADSTGAASGLNLDDEVVAVNNRRVNATTYLEELRGLEPGTTVKLLIARRGELREIDVPLAAKPVEKWHLVRVPKPNRKQKKQWSDWLDTKIESIDEASLPSDFKSESNGDSQK